MSVEQEFVRFSAAKLEQLNGRIQVCLDKLRDDQIWQRGSDNENAVGNLCLHLAGNLRQWIGTGVAGRDDVRDREAEFAALGGKSGAQLRALLTAAVEEAAAVIGRLTPEDLMRRTCVQSYDVTVLAAIYHVVEHFAQHTGQIVFATKAFTGEDIGFYAHLRPHKTGTPPAGSEP